MNIKCMLQIYEWCIFMAMSGKVSLEAMGVKDGSIKGIIDHLNYLVDKDELETSEDESDLQEPAAKVRRQKGGNKGLLLCSESCNKLWSYYTTVFIGKRDVMLNDINPYVIKCVSLTTSNGKYSTDTDQSKTYVAFTDKTYVKDMDCSLEELGFGYVKYLFQHDMFGTKFSWAMVLRYHDIQYEYPFIKCTHDSIGSCIVVPMLHLSPPLIVGIEGPHLYAINAKISVRGQITVSDEHLSARPHTIVYQQYGTQPQRGGSRPRGGTRARGSTRARGGTRPRGGTHARGGTRAGSRAQGGTRPQGTTRP